jgi:protein-disulfide isomerase
MNPTPITEHDHADGPSDAKVTLIEYGDYECPFCVKAYPAIESVRKAYAGRLRFVYRHVPKSRADGFSKQAAEASEFAAAAGKFWQMHEQLFTHAGEHDVEHLVRYAEAIGLDGETCRKALAEKTFAPRVKELAVAAIRSGIVGTPTLFLNGVHYEDKAEAERLSAAIEHALAG